MNYFNIRKFLLQRRYRSAVPGKVSCELNEQFANFAISVQRKWGLTYFGVRRWGLLPIDYIADLTATLQMGGEL